MISCIVPARNEASSLEVTVRKILTIKEIFQIIIIEGGSSDLTFEVAKNLAIQHPNRITCLQQSGKGKFNAVCEAARVVKTDLVMVWDADGTVPLESTKKLIELALLEKCLVMGDRLRGEMQKGAMQLANKIGNWFFAIVWAPIIRKKPTDIFCGTKIAPREVFINTPSLFIKSDPYGDISILLTSRILGVAVMAIPVSYNSRLYGESKMRRWRTGITFLHLTLLAYITLLYKKKLTSNA